MAAITFILTLGSPGEELLLSTSSVTELRSEMLRDIPESTVKNLTL